MVVISVFNLKGGTAKTATSKNMGYLLAKKYGKKVLLTDMDSSGNLSSSFGVRPILCEKDEKGERELQGLARLLVERSADPFDFIVHTDVEGLDIIPSNATLEDAEKLLRMDDVTPQQFRLSRHIRKLQDKYDFCICDCGPHKDLMAINALACSQDVIIPSEVNQDSLDAALRVLEMVDEVSDYNPALRIRGMLFAKIDMRRSTHRQGVEISLPGIRKFNTFIRSSDAAEDSRFYNMAMTEYKEKVKHRGFPAMYDYENFVAEYLGLPYPWARKAPYGVTPCSQC